ncbi:MAG TPA: HD domain-containing phosphohydrolase [Bryobacterales bacterium]|nr:HD domain-containing phosphohydrolase [Bryobacterales bacterium]
MEEAESAEPVQHVQPSTVLVVDDDASIRDYLAEVLRGKGYDCRCFSESLAALSYLNSQNPSADLVLADISMPGMSGIDLLREVKELDPDMPVILISGLYELALAVDALEAGADDYLKKPVRPNDVLALVSRYLEPGSGGEREVQEALLEFLETKRSGSVSLETLRSLFTKLGFKRYETFQHSSRVAATCRIFGERYGLTDEQVGRLEMGALLHDIGKIGIPRNILLKPGSLDGEEWRVMKQHPTIGYRLLREFPELSEEAQIVQSHHERWDGSGYPHGLKGDSIPLGARMFSIVDTLDAITSDRPYRKAQSIGKARAEIRRMSGVQFDPALVEVFLRIPDSDLIRVRKAHPDALQQTA